MHTLDILRQGIIYLDITDPNEISSIVHSNIDNILFAQKCEENQKMRNEYEDRLDIPKGLNKKQYSDILKSTQAMIDSLKKKINETPIESRTFLELDQSDYIEKKRKLNLLLKHHKEFGELNIVKAKQYPIEDLLEFNRSGFAKCIWHSEKTGSLHWDQKRNKAHCFSGCGDFDSIDIYMKLYNVPLKEAVQKLS